MKKTSQIILLIIYIGGVVFLSSWFFSKKLKNDVIDTINYGFDNIKQTNDIIPLTGFNQTGDENPFSDINLDVNVEISDIDKVLSILENGKKGVDFSIITPQPQNIKYSNNVDNDFRNYLVNNIYSLTIPNDIKGGYLYIKLKKPLKYISSIEVYQPITIKTNIYVNDWGVYGRLDISKTLPIYEENKEFLYDLKKIPIKTNKHNETNWILEMRGKLLKIGGFVSDTSSNYIENIVFIWER